MTTPERVERTGVQTASCEEAVENLRQAFGKVRLRPAEEQASRFVLQSYRAPGVSSTRWSFAGVTGGRRIDDEEAPVLLTGVVMSGNAHVWSPQSDVDTSRPFLSPDVADSALEEQDFANLGIAPSVVEQRARAITGLDDFVVRFTHTAPIDQAMDTVWRNTMAYVARTAAVLVDHADSAIAQTALLDLTATVMLRTFPNTTLDAANQRAVTAPRRSAMRRALQFVDDRLGDPITVVDIARAAGLSTRGLYAGFQRDLQTTPMAYLQTARLAAAHDALRNADPSVTSVEAVAAQWGFLDVKRFAKKYGSAYCESPLQTLHR